MCKKGYIWNFITNNCISAYPDVSSGNVSYELKNNKYLDITTYFPNGLLPINLTKGDNLRV
jgi:hypothetical protein